MVPKDVHKTMVITNNGLFEWKIMSFGFKNVTKTFSQTMNEMFDSEMNNWIIMFMDEVNVHSQDWELYSRCISYM
jgi:hypothetical protein